MTTHKMPLAPECFPGVRNYWEAITDVPCPVCAAGTVRWHEAGNVPGWRICDECGQEFMASGDAAAPTLIEQE